MESLWSLLGWLFFFYIIAVSFYIILENRPSTETSAWILLFILLPIIGVIIYIFFGRNQKGVSGGNSLAQFDVVSDPTKPAAKILANQDLALRRLNESPEVSPSEKRLAELLHRTKLSILTTHNQVEILQNASVKYPRLEEDVRQAKHSIHMQYFIWQADPYMQGFAKLLLEKVKEGVQVRILFDAAGSSILTGKHKDYLQMLRDGGVQIFPYLTYMAPFKLHTVNYRNHRKIAVIDGKIGYTGGLNMGEEHLKGAGSYTAWRDTHLRIVGEAVATLQGIFLLGWFNTTKEKLTQPEYFPEVGKIDEYVPLQIVGSGPDTRWYAIQQQYFSMIMAAEKFVYLQSPFFVPDPSIIEALKVAALSGVDVKIMCAPRDTENQISNWAANTYFCDVVSSGARVYFYQPGYLHAKTMCIDGVFCSIGTANMDLRSLQVNYELNTVMYDKCLARQLEQDFLRDLEQCQEFRIEGYRKERIYRRFRDSLARLLSPLL